MIKLIFACLLIFTCWIECAGQQSYLMLQTKNRRKSVYYKRGDEIAFRIGDNKRKISGEIVDLRDSVVVFRGFQVKVSEISSLYIDEKTRWWLRFKIEQLGLIAGGGYLILDVINTGELNSDTLVISGSLITIGLIGKILIGNRIKIKGRTRLRIVRL